MIFIKRTPTPPKSLAQEKLKPSGSYNHDDVREQLQKDFHEKCYICGVRPIQDGGEIEHLISHKGDLEKKFDWNNLFLACGHCNSTKNRGIYSENVIDCTQDIPSEWIVHILTAEGVRVSSIQSNIHASTTANLIEECFNGNTFKRKVAATIRLNELRLEMSAFYKILEQYTQEQLPYYKKQVEALLSNDSKFTAFKRDYIALHSDQYKEFLS